MLEDVYFISMEGKKGFKINNFEVREDVPLPILITDKEISLDDITPERIISGILKVLSDEPDNENLDYYREFIFAVQPDIELKLVSIAYEAERNYKFMEALNFYKLLHVLKPESVDHLLSIAVCYDEYSQYLYKQGRDKEALKYEDLAYEVYKDLEELEEKNDRILYYLGRFYLIQENYEKAKKYLIEFVKVTDEEERKKEVIGVLKDIEESGLEDDDYQMALTLILTDKDLEAIEFIDKYIKKYPSSWNGYFAKGVALRKCNKFDEAIAMLNKALSLNENSVDIYNELGLCYLNLELFSKSEYYFAKALRINPEDTAIMFNLALCALRKGDKELALKYCDVIKEYNPEDVHIKNLKKIIEESSI